MAYGLKYTQYIEKGGARVQIKVYENGWTGASYGMAHVTGLSLQIIGGQSNILSPLLKTSLSFSLVDAWDQGTTQADGTACVNAQNEKCGRWEEFFTPDATKYKVELISKPSPSASASVIWTGFITPDSWSENMIYRGSVTITARDMLGAIQDKEFDLAGRVSVRDVITGALSACECPMALQLTETHFLVNSNGHSVLDHTFAASTFSGDTWAQALEKTLDSLGLVLRYNGANKIVLTSLRYLAADTTLGVHGIEFINRSGLRQLDPALKSITETFDVKRVSYVPKDPDASSFAATGGTITCSMTVARGGSGPGGSQTATGQVKAYNLTRTGNEGWSGTLGIPLYGTAQNGAAVRGIYFPCNAADPNNTLQATYKNTRIDRAFRFRFSLDGGLVLVTNGTSASAVFQPARSSAIFVQDVSVQIKNTASGTTYYLNENGTWVEEAGYLTISLGEEIDVPALNGGEGWEIIVKHVSLGYNGKPRPEAPLVAPLLVEISPEDSYTSPTEFKTTTNYDQNNNVTITREPAIGSASIYGSIDFFENVLAYGYDIVTDSWNWPGEESYYPLAVMIQAQVLCFHAAAASIFTGTAHDKATPGAAALPGYRIGYYDRVGVPLSGTYDFCSGFIAQTIAREFYTWEEVWGTFDPDYTAISGAGKGSTSATGAGGSSAGSGSGGSSGGGTSVNYFEPDEDVEGAVALKADYVAISAPDFLIGENRESLVADIDIIGKSLQSLQAQLDAVASRDSFDELTATALFADIVSVGDRLALGDAILEWDAEHKAWHLIGNFYADGFVTAGGYSSGGGGGGGASLAAMWETLTNTSSDHTYDYTKIHAAHIPDMASAYSYVKTADISNMATKTWVTAQGYITDSAFDNDFATISAALQSLQSQVDSVAARDSFDELTATAAFVDMLAAGSIIADDAEIGGYSLKAIPNAYLANSAITINGTATALGSSFNTANITAGTAGTSSATTGASFAIPYVTVNKYGIVTSYGTHTHSISQANIFGSSAIGSASLPVYYNGSALTACTASSIFSAMSSSAGTNLSVTVAGQNRTATLYATYDSASENISDKFGIVDSALRSLQAQIDSVASRFDWGQNADLEADENFIVEAFQNLQAQVDSLAAKLEDHTVAGYFDTLAVSGGIYTGTILSAGYVTGGAGASDVRLKQNVRTMSDCLEVVMALRPVRFEWNARATELCPVYKGADVGFVAQEVEALLPSAIGTIFDDYMRLDQTKIIAPLVGAVQDHELRIREIEKRLNAN